MSKILIRPRFCHLSIVSHYFFHPSLFLPLCLLNMAVLVRSGLRFNSCWGGSAGVRGWGKGGWRWWLLGRHAFYSSEKTCHSAKFVHIAWHKMSPDTKAGSLTKGHFPCAHAPPQKNGKNKSIKSLPLQLQQNSESHKQHKTHF